jgi:hypothetical protein
MLTDHSHRGPFGRYRSKLTPLIGDEAARALASTSAWFLVGMVSVVLPTLLSVFVDPGSNGVGLALIAGLFLFGCGCLVRFVVIDARCARLASTYLTTQLGRPIRIGAAKLTVAWWQRRIEREKLNIPGAKPFRK